METLGSPALIRRILDTIAGFDGEFSFFARHLASGEEMGIDSDRVMPPASTFKVALMAEAYRQAHVGTLDLDERITLGETVRGSGILRYMDNQPELSVRDLIRLMIIVSDNTATEILLAKVGVARMHEFMDALGLPHIRLLVPFQRELGPRGFGSATARELTALMQLIAEERLVSAEASREMRRHLASQQYGDQIPRYLPFNFYAADLGQEQPLRIANKTGFSPGLRTDTAIVDVEQSGFVITTMTENCSDRGYHPENAGNIVNGIIARLVFEHWYSDRLAALTGQYWPLPVRPFVRE